MRALPRGPFGPYRRSSYVHNVEWSANALITFGSPIYSVSLLDLLVAAVRSEFG